MVPRTRHGGKFGTRHGGKFGLGDAGG